MYGISSTSFRFLFSSAVLSIHIYIPVFPTPMSALKQENFVVNPVSNSAISSYASSTELTHPKLSACLPSSKGSRFKIPAMLFLFVPQESWDFRCSATSLADFRESSVMFCKSLNIPSQSLSTEVVLVDGILMLTVSKNCLVEAINAVKMLNFVWKSQW